VFSEAQVLHCNLLRIYADRFSGHCDGIRSDISRFSGGTISLLSVKAPRFELIIFKLCLLC
jgi:hypothetical protein